MTTDLERKELMSKLINNNFTIHIETNCGSNTGNHSSDYFSRREKDIVV